MSRLATNRVEKYRYTGQRKSTVIQGRGKALKGREWHGGGKAPRGTECNGKVRRTVA